MSATIGHNSRAVMLVPDFDMAAALDPEILTAQMELDHAKLVARRDDLFAAYDRLRTDLGATGLTNDEDAGRASALAKMATTAAGVAEKQHPVVKAPFLGAVRAVDALFLHGIQYPLQELSKKILADFVAPYATASAARKKLLKEEEAAAASLRLQQAREEQERALAAAGRTLSADLSDNLVEAEARVAELEAVVAVAEREASASITDLSRRRSDFGVTTSLSDNWTYTITNIDLVPREWLTFDHAKMRAAIKRKDGPRDVPGLAIVNKPVARNR